MLTRASAPAAPAALSLSLQRRSDSLAARAPRSLSPSSAGAPLEAFDLLQGKTVQVSLVQDLQQGLQMQGPLEEELSGGFSDALPLLFKGHSRLQERRAAGKRGGTQRSRADPARSSRALVPRPLIPR